MKKTISVVLSVLITMSCLIIIGSAEVGATQNRTGNFSRNYSITGNGAEDIVNVARAQLGKTGSQLGYSEQWCADFVSDCAILANQSAAVPAAGYCPTLRQNIIKSVIIINQNTRLPPASSCKAPSWCLQASGQRSFAPCSNS